MTATEIVVALVEEADGRILVRRRDGGPALAATRQGAMWELPGGKIAPGEDPERALAREVEEETGLEVRVGELVCALCHDYGDRRVALHAYRCELIAGEAPPAARWVTLDECRTLAIPAANPPLLDALAWSRARA